MNVKDNQNLNWAFERDLAMKWKIGKHLAHEASSNFNLIDHIQCMCQLEGKKYIIIVRRDVHVYKKLVGHISFM